MKKKKLVKQALEHPELFSDAELIYFDKWLEVKKELKKNGTRRLQIHEASASGTN